MWKVRHISIPIPVHARRSPLPLPGPEKEGEVFRLLSTRRFWIQTSQRTTWTDFPAAEVARLLCLRLHNPIFGAECLLKGGVFKPAPTVQVRLAVVISRLEERQPRLIERKHA